LDVGPLIQDRPLVQVILLHVVKEIPQPLH
jgi:hypothetical protein